MKWLGRLVLLGLLIGSGFLAWRRYEDGRLPSREGRSVRSWFGELCQLASTRGGMEGAARALDIERVILEMGTEVVPFLVGEALDRGRDGPIRDEFRRLLEMIPGKYRKSWVLPKRSLVRAQAAWLVMSLRPSARLLLPVVDAHGREGDDAHRHQALGLLGSVGDDAGLVLPRLFDALVNGEDPWTRDAAAQSLRRLGTRVASQLPTAVDLLDREPVDIGFIDWLAVLGPDAEAAVPGLEKLLGNPTDDIRLHASVALLNIRPAHGPALEVMNEFAGGEGIATPRSHELQTMLENAILQSPGRTNEAIAKVLEPAARREVASWTRTGASYRAVRALERVSPARAERLYREALAGIGGLHAATGLLRIHRDDESVARILADRLAESDSETWMIWGIAEASSRNRVAMDALERLANSGGDFVGSVGVTAGPRFVRASAASYALKKVSFREWRFQRGLPDDLW